MADIAGKILQPWISFFQQFVQAPPQAQALVPGSSPFDYVPNTKGNLFIIGGTVTGITLIRGSTTIVLDPATEIVPVSINDMVTVTYSVMPTIIFMEF